MTLEPVLAAPLVVVKSLFQTIVVDRTPGVNPVADHDFVDRPHLVASGGPTVACVL